MFRKIKGTNLRSRYLIVSPRYKNETFEPLINRKKVTVGCALTNESGEIDYVAVGFASLI